MNESFSDIDYFLKLGFERNVVINALQICKGDRSSTSLLLQKEKISRKDSLWRNETESDWVNYIPLKGLLNSENRGLLKSPFYISIITVKEDEGEGLIYNILISLKDKRQWKLSKKYSEFHTLHLSVTNWKIPFTKNAFPRLGLKDLMFKSLLDENAMVRRRQRMENWIRDFLLNETLMNDENILSAIYNFIEVDKHGGRNYIQQSNLENYSKNQSIALPEDHIVSIFKLPQNELSNCFPLTIANLSIQLPFRVKIKEFEELNENIDLTKDNTEKQLTKDLSRDRLIFQGKRYLGSKTGLESLIEIFIKNINNIGGGKLENFKLNNIELRKTCLELLYSASRTESAFKSHSILSNIIDNSTEIGPIMIVPESLLSDPIDISFRIVEKNEKWCIAVESNCGSCYRLLSTLEEDMPVIMQLKAIYTKTTFIMPELSNVLNEIPFTVKDGSNHLVFEKETTTTKRDWI
jgi:hypothetical protein